MSYRVTVEQITVTEYPETERVYVDKATGKKFRSLFDSGCPPAEFREAVDEPTGRILERKTESTVYEQAFSDLEVNSLAKFLNE